MKPGSFAADRAGAAAVEFALVLVPFLLILFGLLQVGFTYGVMATLNEAATETARALTLSASETDPPTPEAALIEARARFKGPNAERLQVALIATEAGQILRLGYEVPLLLPILDWDVTRLQAEALVGP